MTKNFKGGYKIVSLNGNDLASGDSFVVNWLYENLVNSYKKPILVTEIVIDGEKQQDSFAVVKQSDGGYKIDVYDYALTVTSEDSVSAVVLPEITSIGEGLTLENGELSASGGGGNTLYSHSVQIEGGGADKSASVSFLFISTSNEQLNSAQKLHTVLGNNTSHSANGYYKDSNGQGTIITISIVGDSHSIYCKYTAEGGAPLTGGAITYSGIYDTVRQIQ